MPRFFVLLAGLLIPTHAFATDAGAVKAAIQITGHVPASCRVMTSSLGSEPNWACNNQVPATITRLDADSDQSGATLSRLTIRPVV